MAEQSIGHQLLDVPMGEMIASMGEGIAKAQYQLDSVSIKIAQMMGGGEDDNDLVSFGGQKYSLLELGFTPTFYQFIDTLIEVKISITMTRQQESSGSWSYRTWGSSVNASYSSKYNHSIEGASVLRTKLVPVPAPDILEEIIRDMAAQRKRIEDDPLAKVEDKIDGPSTRT